MLFQNGTETQLQCGGKNEEAKKWGEDQSYLEKKKKTRHLEKGLPPKGTRNKRLREGKTGNTDLYSYTPLQEAINQTNRGGRRAKWGGRWGESERKGLVSIICRLLNKGRVWGRARHTCATKSITLGPRVEWGAHFRGGGGGKNVTSFSRKLGRKTGKSR